MTAEEIAKLSDAEINAAIAQRCGWTNINVPRAETTPWDWMGTDPVGNMDRLLPDYVHSLDAMHEAETALSEEQCEVYNDTLIGVSWDDTQNPPYPARAWVFHYTARQRATAFLLTV